MAAVGEPDQGNDPPSNARRKRNAARVRSSEMARAAVANLNEVRDLVVAAERELRRRVPAEHEIELRNTIASLSRVVEYVENMLQSVNMADVAAESITTILDESTQIASSLDTVLRGENENDISSMLYSIRTMSLQLEGAASSLIEERQRVTEVEASRLRTLADNAAYSTRRMEATLEEANQQLHMLLARISNEAARVESIETELNSLRDRQMVALRGELSAFQDERTKALALAQENLTEAAGVARDKEIADAKNHLDQLGSLLDNAKLMASAVANEKIADHYERSAKAELKSSRRWSWLAIVVGSVISLAVVGIVVLSIYKPVEGTFAAVLRVFAPLIGGSIFIYATLESRNHRRRAWTLTDYAIAHNTIGSVIAPLPKEMQHELLHQAARKMYVSAGDENTEMGIRGIINNPISRNGTD